MSRLALTSGLLAQLRTELLAHKEETCAVLFGRAILKNGRLARIVVRDVQWAGPDDYLRRSQIGAQLRPQFVASVTQRARRNGESLVFVHTHPFDLNEFSETDDLGEQALAEFLESRMPGAIHAALLITPEVTIARRLGTTELLNVVGVGFQLQWGQTEASFSGEPNFDRQARVFGATGQRRLHKLRIGIVGLGGTGSVTLEQLAHLGVGEFLLIDPDTIEPTNLNRLVGATPADVGKQKVAVAAAQVARINPLAKVEAIPDSVLLATVAEQLVDSDFVFCCTDSQGSRAVLNQLAYQFLIPLIDMGVIIVAASGGVSHISGRTQMLAPGLGCLLCGNLLNPEAVRVDLLTDFERNADPYVVGAHEPA
ncbi:MAG: ThiF family adenylyltransferase, partial [Pseudolabrys sp.]|nr:ThiF family adenylyltransferase [Pseudolabrys sp.]